MVLPKGDKRKEKSLQTTNGYDRRYSDGGHEKPSKYDKEGEGIAGKVWY